MAKRIQTVTSPQTKHTSRDATYATLRLTKQTTKLLLRAPEISLGFVLLRGVVIPLPQNKLSRKAACVPANAARPSVYTQQWCIRKERQCTSMGTGGMRQERNSETALSEPHYSGGYLYILDPGCANYGPQYNPSRGYIQLSLTWPSVSINVLEDNVGKVLWSVKTWFVVYLTTFSVTWDYSVEWRDKEW
jgi:hypothetical protein